MTKDKFLTVRWNNILTLALGIPTLIYVLVGVFKYFLGNKGWIDRPCDYRCAVLIRY